jgi:hypothetical protein
MHGNRKPSIPGYLNRHEFGAIVGISYQRLVGLGKSANPPPINADGYIAAADAAVWFENYVLSSQASEAIDVAAIEAQTAKNVSIARKNEIDNAARLGGLVEASEVVTGWQEIKANVEARLNRVPTEGVAAIVSIPADASGRRTAILEALTDVIHAALTDGATVEEEDEPWLPMPPD